MVAKASAIPPRAEPLQPGDFAVLAYRLGRARATGLLAVYPERATAGPEVLVIRRGKLIAPTAPGASTSSRRPGGRPIMGSSIGSGATPTATRDRRDPPPVVLEAGFSRVLVDRRVARKLAELAAWSSGHYTFDGGLLAYPPGAVNRQFPLAAWARSHIEGQLDAARARTLASQLAGVRMSTVRHLAPDPALCNEADLRILDAMRMPRRIDQIWSLSRTPRFRLLCFLHFLRTVGALDTDGIAARPPRSVDARGAHQLLGVSADADRITVKRAYRRMARALHPDLHPGASEERRRALERKLVEVTEAYVALTGSAPAP